MNTHMKTDIWIYYMVIVLSLTTVASAIGSIILTIMGQSLSTVLIMLGAVAITGLASRETGDYDQHRQETFEGDLRKIERTHTFRGNREGHRRLTKRLVARKIWGKLQKCIRQNVPLLYV